MDLFLETLTSVYEAANVSFSRVADDIPRLDFTPLPVSHVPDEYIIGPETVQSCLSWIQMCKSVGPEWNSELMVEELCPSYKPPHLFHLQFTLQTGCIPSLWKCVDVSSLGKVPRLGILILTLDPSPWQLSSSNSWKDLSLVGWLPS